MPVLLPVGQFLSVARNGPHQSQLLKPFSGSLRIEQDPALAARTKTAVEVADQGVVGARGAGMGWGEVRFDVRYRAER